jgi:hypothetical protein
MPHPRVPRRRPKVGHERTPRSAQTLRNIVGPIRLELGTADISRPFCRAALLLGTMDGCASIRAPDERVLLNGFERTVTAEANSFREFAARPAASD